MQKIIFILFDSINKLEINSIIKKDCISGLCNLSKVSIRHSFGLPELDFEECSELINKETQQRFVEFIKHTSTAKNEQGDDIRRHTISGLPLYWLTEYSVKHPYNHYLYSLFFLDSLIKHGFVNIENVVIYCPKKYSFLESLLLQFFPENTLRFHRKPKRAFLDYLRFLKVNSLVIIKIVRQHLHRSSKKINKKESVVYFTKLKETSYLNRVVKGFERINLNIGNSISVDYGAWVLWKKMHNSLLCCIPSLIELLQIFYQLFRVKTCLNNEIITIQGKRYPTEFINHELNKLICTNPYNIYSYIWLSKFFKKHTVSIKAIYEDEFYCYGRVISAAKINSKNSRIVCYGIQHGMFSENHTVYNISDVELNSTSLLTKNGLPIPDFFITWGGYFTTFFLRNNGLNREFILELGNPLYVFNEVLDNIDVENQQADEIRILYCLTSSKLFYQEIEIVNRILIENENVHLVVRHHPNFKFEIDKKLFKNCKKISISESTSLQQDFSQAQLVITSAHSTIFMDALSYNKAVIRLKTSIYDSTMVQNYVNCLTIDKEYKGELRVDTIYKNLQETLKSESFIYKNNDRWHFFFQ